ncbi:MAG: hypothetical protein MI867_10455 [Pseudomonadales bacterium]|nr:hypothetical protein [Pseudomonadales bacterium]
MVEYVVVLSFFMIMLWYAMVGGSSDWTDPETTEGTGAQVDRTFDNPPAYPGLVNALHDKQESFRSRVYQP